MAPPVPVSVGTVSTGTVASFAVAAPPSVAVNDFLILVLFKENNAAVTVPSGWNPLTPQAPATDTVLYVWTKVATAADQAGPYNISWTGSIIAEAVAMRITGESVSAPLDTGAGAPNSAGRASTGTTTPAVSLTTQGPDRLLVFIGAEYATGGTWTVPTGFTSRYSNATRLLLATNTQAVAGATGSITATNTTAEYQDAYLLAVAPPTAVAAAATITGSLTVTDAASASVSAAASITGAETTTVGAKASVPAAASISGSCTVTAAATATVKPAVSITGTETVSVAAKAAVSAAASISGALTVITLAAVPQFIAASITGTETTTAGATRVVPAAASISCTFSLTIGDFVNYAVAQATATGTLIAIPQLHGNAQVDSSSPSILQRVPHLASSPLVASAAATGILIAALPNRQTVTVQASITFNDILGRLRILSGVGVGDASAHAAAHVVTRWTAVQRVLAQARAGERPPRVVTTTGEADATARIRTDIYVRSMGGAAIATTHGSGAIHLGAFYHLAKADATAHGNLHPIRHMDAVILAHSSISAARIDVVAKLSSVIAIISGSTLFPDDPAAPGTLFGARLRPRPTIVTLDDPPATDPEELVVVRRSMTVRR